MDIYYTSKDLLLKLLEKKILVCGTLRRKWKGFPKQLSYSVKKSYRGDFRWVWDDRLVFYEWHDNNQVQYYVICYIKVNY
jgi:hypothetical protein